MCASPESVVVLRALSYCRNFSILYFSHPLTRHLITLSARTSTFGGIVRPICFAVFTRMHRQRPARSFFPPQVCPHILGKILWPLSDTHDP